MAGIYIHIPYCKQACNYCDFHFSTTRTTQDNFGSALLREIELTEGYLDGESLGSIYFGGGTPSIMPSVFIEQVIAKIKRVHACSPDLEITLEANPDDLNREYLQAIHETGVNRLSIGIQSFRNEDLQLMNRAHSSIDARQCMQDARKAGFENINCDLIYGIPDLSQKDWQNNLEEMASFEPEHLSLYALTIEPQTAFHNWVDTGKMKPVKDDLQADQFVAAKDFLTKLGYEHYEISNYSKPGFRSRHNASYWLGAKYLGLGPSAHSYNGTSRRWNVANNRKYIAAMESGQLDYEEEQLDAVTRYNEYVLTSLRTSWGADLNFIKDHFGLALAEDFKNAATFRIESGLMKVDSATYTLTDEGFLLADRIASDLFADSHETADKS